MSASDGAVGALEKIVDNGPNRDRWNLVILGDGYAVAELAKYHSDVQQFVLTLRATSPFDKLWPAINVHRVDVVSTDSGADDPVDCPDGAGSGARPLTFFDASFCSVAPGGVRISRLLTGDSDRAEDVAKRAVPEVHQEHSLSSTRANMAAPAGRSRYARPTSAQRRSHSTKSDTRHSTWERRKYGGNGTGTPLGEPPHANVTRDKRALEKWHEFDCADDADAHGLRAGMRGLRAACQPTLTGHGRDLRGRNVFGVRHL